MTGPGIVVAPPHPETDPCEARPQNGGSQNGSSRNGGQPDGDPRQRNPLDEWLHDEAARVRLGATSTTPADILLALARDPSVVVRTALTLNPSAPPATFGVLAHDSDERVRTLLAGKLAALAPRLSETEQSRLGQQAAEALGQLVEDTAVRVRAAIAEVVKEMPDAPRDLVLRLARDAEVRVSEPVIRLSPLLTQADLLSLLAASNAPEVALAVARRPGLTEDVADAVAGTAHVAAIRAMLLNHSAQIRESTLDALIARAAGHAEWHAPLVRRPHLSPRAAAALSRIIADALLVELASRADVPPSVVAELRARVASRLARAGGAGRQADPDPTEPGPSGPQLPNSLATDLHATDARDAGDVPATDAHATDDRPTNARPTDHSAEARARAAAGRLTEPEMLNVARSGDRGLAAAMLALAADVPLAVVERAATLRSAKGMVSLVWKAGFSMKLAIPLQSMLARLGPGTMLASGPGGTFPLAVGEMRWQLEFLRSGVAPTPSAHSVTARSRAPASIPPRSPTAG